MKTLIELYDDRAIENILGVEMFRPQKVVVLCPEEIAEDARKKQILIDFFKARGLDCKMEFVACSMYHSNHILKQLKKIAEENPDCAIDITGGTDTALFAAGMFCSESGIPAFTYSRKNNRFYNICNAEFARDLECDLEYTVAEFFAMAGGKLRQGRVDNSVLENYIEKFDGFFEIYLKHKREWAKQITFMQRISQADKDMDAPLYVSGEWKQRDERGNTVSANLGFLCDLKRLGFITNLKATPGQSVRFGFADQQIRSWLRDVGSVLELYMYKLCLDSGIFKEVISSAVVDWDDNRGVDGVSNEIDVAASKYIIPLFISCKTCEIKTEAINELAILKERFGGKGAKAIIVTTEKCGAAARHRAAQLGIAVIDIEELETGKAMERLKIIMKAAK